MLGYKIYFDGEKFVAEDTESQVGHGNGYLDHAVKWVGGRQYVKNAIESLTKSHKQNENELESDTDFLVRKCKDCGEWFFLTARDVHHFQSKMLTLPCRCRDCREKRRLAKMKQQIID